MLKYQNMLQTLLYNGTMKDDRTGTGTYSIFGYQERFHLQQGFPLLTTKKLNWNAIVVELAWFLRGDTNIKYLNDHGVHIWDPWADKQGNLGPVYGAQWRNWGCGLYDQINEVIQEIKVNPDSRRLVVTAWNPAELDFMALPPCHCLFQFYVHDGFLNCQLYQRSADVFLGVPFNIASYGLLTHLVAHVTGLKPGTFVHTFGDLHLYRNHVEQAYQQLSRTPRPLPQIKIREGLKDIDDFEPEDVQVIGYDPHPHIKAEIAV